MMREPLLEDSFSRPAYSSESESEKAPQVKRRQFLQTVGLAGAGLILAPKVVMSQSSDVARWRDTITDFVYTVCEDRRLARSIVSQVRNADFEWAGETSDFHYYYSAPLLFAGTTVSPVEVVCTNGFEIKRYAFYDNRCPCGSISDLNAFEMRRVINRNEISEYGCVMTPSGRRQSLVGYADHANYRRTAENYGLDPDQYKPVAKRVFRGKRRAVHGFQIEEKTPSGSNGSRKKDVLLSSEDV